MNLQEFKGSIQIPCPITVIQNGTSSASFKYKKKGSPLNPVKPHSISVIYKPTPSILDRGRNKYILIDQAEGVHGTEERDGLCEMIFIGRASLNFYTT